MLLPMLGIFLKKILSMVSNIVITGLCMLIKYFMHVLKYVLYMEACVSKPVFWYSVFAG